MDETTTKSGRAERSATFLVVRYLDGRPAVIDDETDDVCPVHEPDTVPAAAAWLFGERGFERCRRADAIAEVVLVTVDMPDHLADLEATLQVATEAASVTYGFVRAIDLYAKVSQTHHI